MRRPAGRLVQVDTLPPDVCRVGLTREEDDRWKGRINVPRKEVIQPHLPVRLPCYDFVPVAKPTLGRCLPCGLAHGLQVFPTPMT